MKSQTVIADKMTMRLRESLTYGCFTCECERMSNVIDPENLDLAHEYEVSRILEICNGDRIAAALFDVLTSAGFIHHFSLNYSAGRGEVYHLDFAHPEAKVAIDLHCVQKYGAQFNRERARNKFLKVNGWKLIRVGELS